MAVIPQCHTTDSEHLNKIMTGNEPLKQAINKPRGEGVDL